VISKAPEYEGDFLKLLYASLMDELLRREMKHNLRVPMKDMKEKLRLAALEPGVGDSLRAKIVYVLTYSDNKNMLRELDLVLSKLEGQGFSQKSLCLIL
jgi:hypothetical protein